VRFRESDLLSAMQAWTTQAVGHRR
jgi:hypothetical protein